MSNFYVMLMKAYMLILYLLFFFSCKEEAVPEVDEAKAAWEYLNKVRQDPDIYSSELGVDLSYVPPIHALVWNDTLALAARNKVTDMATRGYFDHVDPEGDGMNIKIHEAGYLLDSLFITDRSNNFFESLAAGNATAVEAIQTLIIDKGLQPPGHRNHLLGITPFYAGCYDIGIGFVKVPGAQFSSYCCVLIAKKGF